MKTTKKKCYKCGEAKEATLGFFRKRTRNPDGLLGMCIDCSREIDRLRYHAQDRRNQKRQWNKTDNGRLSRYITNLKKYGLLEQDFRDLQDVQKGCCATCGNSLVNPEFSRNDCHIDHCHKTGKVRGLLCKRCNTSIGALEDRIEILENIIDYLKS